MITRKLLVMLVVPLTTTVIWSCTETTTPSRPRTEPATRADVIGSSASLDIQAGYFHTCALKPTGTASCWGNSQYGQLNIPNGLNSLERLAVGDYHTCGLKNDATVVCWGYNFYGQADVPQGLASVIQIDAGRHHTCALKSDGTVVCWGANYSGQTSVPPGLTSVAQISAGGLHTCAIRTDASVTCWSSNQYGESAVPAGIAASEITAGGLHTCALTIGGSLRCWGRNSFGESDVPVDLPSVVQVSAGLDHTCVVKDDGTVRCWGQNAYGQASVPTALSGVIRVSAGVYHNCALRSNATAVCWGNNGYGQTVVPPNLFVSGAPPVIDAIYLPSVPVPLGNPVTASASFMDSDEGDNHTAWISWDDVTLSPATVVKSGVAGTISASHVFQQAGIYTITVSVHDGFSLSTRESSLDLPAYIVVYDPSGGFVSGAGWIESPAFACPLICAGEAGKATFGFVSRYKQGVSVPEGNTQFEFRAGNLSFTSTHYDWLVVAGARAQYKGEGTVNDIPGYSFLLTAIDGDKLGGRQPDRFRIKIVNAAGTIAYDNQMGSAEDSDMTTALGGGGIVVHK